MDVRFTAYNKNPDNMLSTSQQAHSTSLTHEITAPVEPRRPWLAAARSVEEAPARNLQSRGPQSTLNQAKQEIMQRERTASPAMRR